MRNGRRRGGAAAAAATGRLLGASVLLLPPVVIPSDTIGMTLAPEPEPELQPAWDAVEDDPDLEVGLEPVADGSGIRIFRPGT